MSRAPCASGFAGSGNATSLRKSRPRVFGQHAVLLIAGGPGLVVAQTSFGPPASADTTLRPVRYASPCIRSQRSSAEQSWVQATLAYSGAAVTMRAERW
jgi:hypothetical protein